MDGLSVDTEPMWLQTEVELANEYGADWSLADQAHCLGGPMSKVGIHLAEKSNRPDLAEWFSEEMVRRMAHRCSLGVGFMPGVEVLLDEISDQGIPVGLVSASPRNIVDAVLDNLGHDLFPFSISSDDVSVTKPNPECYLKAAALSQSEISNCLVFEDSLTGMNAAISSGARLIAVPHLVSIEESPTVRVIKSLEQLNYEKLKSLFKDFSQAI